MKQRAFHAPRGARPAVLVLTVLTAASAHSQTAVLPETVVTATRSPTRADELVSDVRVIDRAAIEAASARTLPELLARTAGVQMTSNGGRGKSSSVFIRGTESRHTILLVDGVRVGSATTGAPSWEGIPVELIERIEVLKGPASALYGSEGVGGVVQIFTRKGREGFHPNAALTVGSERHWAASAGLAAGQGALKYSLGVQRLRERGINATQPYVPFRNYNPDVDPFHQDSLNASIAYDLTRDWSVDASVLHSDGITWFDEGPGRDARAALRTLAAQAGVTGRILPGWQTELRFSQGDDTFNNIVSAFPGAFKTEQSQWTWQNTVDTPAGVVLAGLERREQEVSGTTAYTVTERSIDSAFAGLNGSAGAHSWQFNLRRDRNSQFGSSDTGFVGYGYRISPAWRAHASYGTSFVAPSFNQLYFPGFGNPAVQPERGRNRDYGVTWSQGGHEVKLVRFDNRLTNLIATSGRTVANVGRARIDGWSLGYAASMDRLRLRTDLEWLDPRNEVNDRQLPRRAKRQATLGADYALQSWRFGTSLLHVDSRFDDVANTRRLGGYTTVDLYADWQFARDWSLQGRLNNATDKRYETAYGYNQPGRAAYLTLRWQPR